MIAGAMAWISRWVLLAAAGVIAASLLALGVQGHRLKVAKAETQQVKDAWTLDRAQRTQVALEATTKARAKEQADAAKLKEVQDAYAALQSDHARDLAAQRVVLADNGRMRNALAAYAAGGGSGAPDTVAAASERAARLGSLLAEALRSDAESAAGAEAASDGVRALLAAWPHEDVSISLPRMKLGG